MTALAAGPVQDALGDVARFVPKLLLFLIILVLGWLAARLLRAGVSRALRRIGFDQAVERGGLGRVLGYTRYDARSLMTALVYYAVLLFTLQLAFGIWGPNPVSALIAGIVAWLPRAFVAIVIIVVAAAVAAGVRNVITGALGGLSYGRLLANLAGGFIIGIGIIAALDQIGVAMSVTTPVLIAILATVAGILIVGVGGGLVRPMQSRWETWLNRAEQEVPQVREQLRVAAEERETRAAAEREEAARREAEARAAAEAEAARQQAEAARQQAEAARQEAEARAAAEREEEARREAEAQRAREAELQQAARDEAARIEAEREEAARQDAARAEAARQEVAQREAAQAEEAAREGAAREEAAREQAATEEAASEQTVSEQTVGEPAAPAEAAPAKKRTTRPRTARERAEQAAARRAAAEAGTLPQAPPSDEPTVAIDVSRLRGGTSGAAQDTSAQDASAQDASAQDAEETQRITVPAADNGDDPERTQAIPLPEQPEQPAPSTPRRRRPQGGGAAGK